MRNDDLPGFAEDPAAATSRAHHPGCLLCGDRNPRSLRLRFEAWGEGQVRSTFRGDETLQGYQGVLHGGVIAALLDSAMTHCLFHQDVQAVTADLRVRYLALVPCGEHLDIRARILSSGRRLYRLRAELLCSGRPLAWAEAKFVRI